MEPSDSGCQDLVTNLFFACSLSHLDVSTYFTCRRAAQPVGVRLLLGHGCLHAGLLTYQCLVAWMGRVLG